MTKFHILTLFPEMVLQGLGPSIIGRAAEKGIISLDAVNIRDYTLDRHGKVDDYPYGGGAGMLMQAQPVYDAHRAVTGGRAVRTVYVTPQGTPFTQRMAEDFAREEELVFLCGHYEGIDERVLEKVVTDQVSIGDYVLTGGELPAMTVHRKRRASITICWNIPSIPGRRNGRGCGCRRCSCPAITDRCQPGGWSSPDSALRPGGPICTRSIRKSSS